MRAPKSVLAAAAFMMLCGFSPASESGDAEVQAWSTAYTAWIDVSHNITCPVLKPRIDALTTRLGDVQDEFVARHPDYVFPPMIFASQPFVDCERGTLLVKKAEGLAEQVAGLMRP